MSDLVNEAVELRLESDSDIMLEQTRTIDKRRMTSAMLTILTEKEISDVEAYWRIVIGL